MSAVSWRWALCCDLPRPHSYLLQLRKTGSFCARLSPLGCKPGGRYYRSSISKSSSQTPRIPTSQSLNPQVRPFEAKPPEARAPKSLEDTSLVPKRECSKLRPKNPLQLFPKLRLNNPLHVLLKPEIPSQMIYFRT